MTGKTENEIIPAAKELGIKLTNAKPGSELWEEAWGDPVKHSKLCADDGRMEECKVATEDANGYAWGAPLLCLPVLAISITRRHSLRGSLRRP